MNVHRSLATTEELVLIYLKVTVASVRRATPELIVRTKDRIALTARVPREQCVKTNRVTTITLVCADPAIQATIVTLR